MMVYKPSILIVDMDIDLAELITAVLTDEGFLVTLSADYGALPDLVARLEPDAVILEIKGYGDSMAWDAAQMLRSRGIPVPLLLVTTSRDVRAMLTAMPNGEAFANVIEAPFDLNDLLTKAVRAVGEKAPIGIAPHRRPSPSVADLLRRAGVKDLVAAPDREWVTFRDAAGAFVQIYWWEKANAYVIIRIPVAGGAAEDLGKCRTADEAVRRALGR